MPVRGRVSMQNYAGWRFQDRRYAASRCPARGRVSKLGVVQAGGALPEAMGGEEQEEDPPAVADCTLRYPAPRGPPVLSLTHSLSSSLHSHSCSRSLGCSPSPSPPPSLPPSLPPFLSPSLARKHALTDRCAVVALSLHRSF